MNISTITVIIAILSISGIVRTISRVRRDQMGLRAASVWIILWTVLAFFALFPSAIDVLMNVAQMADRLFFITTCGVLVALALIFELTTKVDTLRRQVARLVQEHALAEWRGARGRPPEVPEESPDVRGGRSPA